MILFIGNPAAYPLGSLNDFDLIDMSWLKKIFGYCGPHTLIHRKKISKSFPIMI